MQNPFEFGRELGGNELADRQSEVELVTRTMHERGRLFLIGPRRFGKTSILRAAAELAENEGVAVLRYNAEAFPTLEGLGRVIVQDATKVLTGTARQVGTRIQSFFSALRPQISFSPLDQSWSVTLTAQAPSEGQIALIADTLDGVDRLAAHAERPLAVVIDEFQRLVEIGGVSAEAQLRAAVQRHAHVGYVFAGSKTTVLTQMTGDSSRPFYRLGSRLFVGPVPRDDFAPYLVDRFENTGMTVTQAGVTRVLDRSADVPYNVQRLAHACWNRVRETETVRLIDADLVDEVLEELIRRDDPFYTQTWNRIAANQQKALLALTDGDGLGLYSKDLLSRYSIAQSSMRTALQALQNQGIVRTDEWSGSVRYVLEDPFFGAWIGLFVVRPERDR